MQHLGLAPSILKKNEAKIEILSNNYVLCREFVAVCKKLQLLALFSHFKPRRL